jgi:hypothetical protein
MRANSDALDRLMRQAETESADPLATLALKSHIREAEAEAGAALTKLTESRNIRDLRSALLSQESERVAGSLSVLSTLNEFDNAAAAKGLPRSFLGFDPLRPGLSVVNSDPNVVRAVSERVRPLLDEYKTAVREQGVAENLGRPDAHQSIVDKQTTESLSAHLNDLRNQIIRETEPLRSGPATTIEDLEEVVRQNDRAQLTAEQKAIIDLSDSDAKALSLEVDALQPEAAPWRSWASPSTRPSACKSSSSARRT